MLSRVRAAGGSGAGGAGGRRSADAPRQGEIGRRRALQSRQRITPLAFAAARRVRVIVDIGPDPLVGALAILTLAHAPLARVAAHLLASAAVGSAGPFVAKV